LLGLGGGAFSVPVNQLIPENSDLPLVGNFYDDNAMDVIVEGSYGVDLFLGQGARRSRSALLHPQCTWRQRHAYASIAATMSNRPSPQAPYPFTTERRCLARRP